MDELLYYANLSPFKEIINSNDLRIAKTNTKINEFIIMLDFIKNDKTIFVVLPTLSKAQTYYDDLIKYLPFEKVLFFPADELITSEMLSSQGDFLYERLQTLISLLSDNKYIVITNTNGIIKREFPKEVFAKCIFKLKKGQCNCCPFIFLMLILYVIKSFRSFSPSIPLPNKDLCATYSNARRR